MQPRATFVMRTPLADSVYPRLQSTGKYVTLLKLGFASELSCKRNIASRVGAAQPESSHSVHAAAQVGHVKC